MKKIKSFDVKAFPGRVKNVRDSLKLLQKDFAGKLGFASSMLSNIENGKTDPGYDFLLRLVDVFCVSPNYILLGEGEMFLKNEEHIHDDANFGEQTGDVKKLLAYFAKSSLVKMSVLAYATKFILTNDEIINKEIGKKPQKTEKGK